MYQVYTVTLILFVQNTMLADTFLNRGNPSLSVM